MLGILLCHGLSYLYQFVSALFFSFLFMLCYVMLCSEPQRAHLYLVSKMRRNQNVSEAQLECLLVCKHREKREPLTQCHVRNLTWALTLHQHIQLRNSIMFSCVQIVSLNDKLHYANCQTPSRDFHVSFIIVLHTNRYKKLKKKKGKFITKLHST